MGFVGRGAGGSGGGGSSSVTKPSGTFVGADWLRSVGFELQNFFLQKQIRTSVTTITRKMMSRTTIFELTIFDPENEHYHYLNLE